MTSPSSLLAGLIPACSRLHPSMITGHWRRPGTLFDRKSVSARQRLDCNVPMLFAHDVFAPETLSCGHRGWFATMDEDAAISGESVRSAGELA